MTPHLKYDNPLVTRYAGRAMAELWGPQRKYSTWRRLWLALAESQAELGMPAADGNTPRIQPQQLEELRLHLDDIDFQKAHEYEAHLHHDVMAHIHTLADAAPGSRDIIHLGATSCFVTDNTDLILMREGLGLVRDRLVRTIDALAKFAEQYAGLPTVGFTHFQPAQLTTVGKRASLWCYDFVLDLNEVEYRLNGLKFRGAKGTVGTQASFLDLFQGDHAKVGELDHRIAAKMGFSQTLPVTGQTYTRKLDSQVLDTLSGIAQSAAKLATDLRLLAHEREIEEAFGADQVGSTAMAYKQNPVRCERVCSIARYVSGLAPIAAQTASTQWLERSLDDSAARRIYLPEAFLGTDAILSLVASIIGGLRVNETVIAEHVAEMLPNVATEELLMKAVAQGGDRQALHERIRIHCRDLALQQKAGKAGPSISERIAVDSTFLGLTLRDDIRPEFFIGRADEQVREFLEGVVNPIRHRYL